MDRRTVLGLVAAAVGVGTPGCNSDEPADGADRFADGPPGGTDGGAEEPGVEAESDDLDIQGTLTGTPETWQVQIVVENTTAERITAEFAGEVRLHETDDVLVSDTVELTIDDFEAESVTLDLADDNALSYRERVGLLFEGFELRILRDGRPQPNVCPNSAVTDPVQTGCNYQTPNPAYLTVDYTGDWAGSMTVGPLSAAVDRASDGAPDGESVSYLDIDEEADVAAASITKADDDTDEELTVAIHHEGDVVASDGTTAPDETVRVSTTF